MVLSCVLDAAISSTRVLIANYFHVSGIKEVIGFFS